MITRDEFLATLENELPQIDMEWFAKVYRIRNRLFTNLLAVKSRFAALGPEHPDFPRGG